MATHDTIPDGVLSKIAKLNGVPPTRRGQMNLSVRDGITKTNKAARSREIDFNSAVVRRQLGRIKHSARELAQAFHALGAGAERKLWWWLEDDYGLPMIPV